MVSFVRCLALSGALFLILSGSARALEPTSPKVRIGASAGVVGTLPVGDDVGQPGYSDEFEKGLWIHVDVFQADIGPYVQLSGFFRLALAGGYSGGALSASIDPARLAGPPDSKLALAGLSGRFFPFGDGGVRPFLSFGLAYSMAGARLNTCPSNPAPPGEGGGGSPVDMLGEGDPGEMAGTSTCNQATLLGASRKHQGLAFVFGLGVRFDPTVRGFAKEQWRLPIALELGYVKNVWLGMVRDPNGIWEDASYQGQPDGRLQDDPAAVAGNGPNVDYLGLLLTVGFLR